MSIREQRENALQRWASLVNERSSWVGDWKELAHFIWPRAGRFDDTTSGSAPNNGQRRNRHIIDSTATRSLGILQAGLLSGASSPARPWFRLKTPDDELNEREPVKLWLFKVQQRMLHLFNRTNTYRTLRYMYGELGCFGTAGNICLPNFERVLHNYPLTVGQYCIDADAEGRVNTMYRKLLLNVGQTVMSFGYENCSNHVKAMYDSKNLNAWVPVLHVIEPRRERDPLKFDAKNMPYKSVYYEFAGQLDDCLRESGHREFPGLFPRWELRGEDIYGTGPGDNVIGDVKQLQHQQLRKSQGIDFQTLPPLAVPVSAQSSGLNLNPGAVNYVDTGTNGARSLFDVQLDLSHLKEDIIDVRGRIERGFFVDLFLLIMSDSREQPASAREIAERHEEKLLMLGPVLESLHDELLSPYIELAFHYMLEAGLVPTPPEELEGMPLSIQFVSLLAQAQRLVGLQSVERLIGAVVNVAGAVPHALDKVDFDKAIEAYGDMLGVDPSLIVADDKVALIREQRAGQQQRAEQAALAQQGAQVAKDLGAAGEEGMSAVANVARQLGIV